MRRSLVAVVVLLAAVVAGGAFAAAADKEQHKFNAADQAAAKRAVISKTDLAATGWVGGAKAPDLTPPQPCTNWNPKQSDLVLTGVAETDWKHAGLELDTEAQVLQTAQMVTLDWQRTVADPHVLPCLKQHIQQQVAKSTGIKFVSFGRVAFPKVGTYSRAYLTVIAVTSNGKTVQVAIEDVLIGNKRTELTITSTTAKTAQPTIAAADIKLAKTLAGRAKA